MDRHNTGKQHTGFSYTTQPQPDYGYTAQQQSGNRQITQPQSDYRYTSQQPSSYGYTTQSQPGHGYTTQFQGYENVVNRKPLPPVNVLVIGPSQNGKSTFINLVRSMAVKAQCPPPRMGKGTVACTRNTRVYELDVPTTAYKLVDQATSFDVDIPEDEETIFNRLWKKKNFDIAPTDPYAPLMRLRLIDSPGLDDSGGKDAENIQSVLQYLVKLSESKEPSERYINSILFVCNANTAFSDGFQTIYKYYEKCMPNLFGGMAIVNTNFGVTTWKQKHQTYSVKNAAMSVKGAAHSLTSVFAESARVLTMKQRRSDFANLFGRDPRHFFIDSKPKERLPFERVTSMNTVSEILSFFCSQGQFPITQMRLFKFPKMLSIDGVLINYLNAAKHRWETERSRLLSSASTTQIVLSQLTKSSLELEAEIARLEKELDRWTADVEYNLNTYTTKDPTSMPSRIWKMITFSKIKNSYSITESISPFVVDAPDNSEARWISKTMDPTTKTWTGEYQANYAKVPLLSMRSYTFNKHWYAQEIMEASSRKRKIQALLAANESALAAQREAMGSSDGVDPRVKQLSEWISSCESLIKVLRSEEVPLSEGFNAAARKRYRRKDASRVGRKDLFEMAVAEDREFEGALRLVKDLFPETPDEEYGEEEEKEDEDEIVGIQNGINGMNIGTEGSRF